MSTRELTAVGSRPPLSREASGEVADRGEEPVVGRAAAASTQVGPSEGAPVTVDCGRDWRHPSTNAVVVMVLLVIGVRVGLTPLHDNSFLTHLATGRLILDRGSIPTADPYSFTAPGNAWTVQSWGASVVYAGLERAVGLIGIRILHLSFTVSLILLLWRLTRRASGLLARLVPVALVCCMGTSLWVERPLLFGTIALALFLLAADEGLDPRWLVPVMWVWVNTHGSFPLGLVLLALLVAGRWLDQRLRPTVELRALGWASLGTALAAINPIGPRLLAFPARLLADREAFSHVVEWKPPQFHNGVERFFAVQLALVAVLVVTRHRRWRAILPVVVFGLAAMTSARNILPASVVFTPIMAVALSAMGVISGSRRPRLLRPVAVAVALILALVSVDGLLGRDTALGAYPEQAASWMREQDLLGRSDRVVASDWVGNYLEYRYGPDEVRVFFDDRVDMYPIDVIDDYASLLDDDSDHQQVLKRHRATAVLWERRSDLGRWLSTSKRWQVVYDREGWLVAVPSQANPGS